MEENEKGLELIKVLERIQQELDDKSLEMDIHDLRDWASDINFFLIEFVKQVRINFIKLAKFEKIIYNRDVI